jgi:hypothetical protein
MAFQDRFDFPGTSAGRRRFLMTALAGGLTVAHAPRMFAGSDFWNKEDPSAWTEEEIGMLTSKSPWARAAVPTFKGADDPTGASGHRTGMRIASETVIVRWESAQPILDALKAALSPDFAGHYVVSVTNLPGSEAPRRGRGGEMPPDDVLDRMQGGATLHAKGKDAAEAGVARRSRIGSVLFGFSKDYLRLTPGDRDIVFKLDTGQLVLSAKFDAKDMNYRGKLAV